MGKGLPLTTFLVTALALWGIYLYRQQKGAA